jgi:flagellar hook assembly protein FlgD
MPVVPAGASLSQNAPNPFNQTTAIRYTVPQNAGNALIQITDINGRAVKTIPVTAKGSGQITLQAGELTAGTYQYALIVNGRLIDTKRMILTK